MFFLFSGEGPTDLGLCAHSAATCSGVDYLVGPMTVVVEQIVERRHNYSLLESQHCGFVSRQHLVERASDMKAAKKGIRLPGKKRAKETRYFFNNARTFARIAKEMQGELNAEVAAVLFRDADRAAAGRGIWDEKQQSMMDGFKQEGFERGVPMIPDPASEVWILSALKPERSHRRRGAERRSSGALKAVLEKRLGNPATREKLCQLVVDRIVDWEKIDLPSFSAFRSRLEEVI